MKDRSMAHRQTVTLINWVAWWTGSHRKLMLVSVSKDGKALEREILCHRASAKPQPVASAHLYSLSWSIKREGIKNIISNIKSKRGFSLLFHQILLFQANQNQDKYFASLNNYNVTYTTDCRKMHKAYSDSLKLVSTAQNTVCTSTSKSN